jgi:hypothetical protein
VRSERVSEWQRRGMDGFKDALLRHQGNSISAITQIA